MNSNKLFILTNMNMKINENYFLFKREIVLIFDYFNIVTIIILKINLRSERYILLTCRAERPGPVKYSAF